MKRSMFFDTNCSSRSMQVRLVIAIFLATAFHTSSLCAQEDRVFVHGPAMVMLDNSIPDFVAITRLEGIFGDKEKEFGYLSQAKKYSLGIRKIHNQMMQDTLANRVGQAAAELDLLQRQLEKNDLKAQSRPSVYAASMASAEQLLISAQLELQKVSWELATEQELLENVEKAEVNSKTAGNEIEKETLMLELQNLQTDLQFAEKELATVENLEKRSAINASEAAKAKQSFTKTKNALKMSELRLREQETKHDALAKAKSAEIASHVRKLTARKTHIESYIQELLSSMNDLSHRQIILTKIALVEKELAANEKTHREWITKNEEIEGLLSILDTAELSDKKVKE